MLREWRETPTALLSELRDQGLLKLFFGADPATLAPVQLEAHRRKLAEYEELRSRDPGDGPPRPLAGAGGGHRRGEALDRLLGDGWSCVARCSRDRTIALRSSLA